MIQKFIGAIVLLIILSSTAIVSAQESDGYILFTPLNGTDTYLINNQGQVVHQWNSDYQPGNSVYLLENGHLLRTARVPSQRFNAGGVGGRIEEFTWDGELVWAYELASDVGQLHHDIEPLPNGNILMIAWEYKSAEEATAAGRDPALISAENEGPGGGRRQNTNTEPSLWADAIFEVDPTTNEIVWEWHVWDHLVQDYDPALPNYGNPAEHPELIDLNYVGGRATIDWTHVNAVDYNPQRDEILLSVHNFSEIWVIDHTNGDLVYRWGNPAAYGADGEQQLFQQHDSQWITPGLPGEGNILIFNNGQRRSREWSSIEEITPHMDANGNYQLSADAVWQYAAQGFYAMNISGVQRQPNGNTLICDGPAGHFFEVNAAGEIVWEYTNPISTQTPQGTQNSVFRAERYAPDFPAFTGVDLTVGVALGS